MISNPRSDGTRALLWCRDAHLAGDADSPASRGSRERQGSNAVWEAVNGGGDALAALCRARAVVGAVVVGKGKQDTPTSAIQRRVRRLLSLCADSGHGGVLAARTQERAWSGVACVIARTAEERGERPAGLA